MIEAIANLGGGILGLFGGNSSRQNGQDNPFIQQGSQYQGIDYNNETKKNRTVGYLVIGSFFTFIGVILYRFTR